jgi:uncharacterized protein YkwD
MRIRRLVILGMVGALLLAAAPTPAQAGERSKTYRTRVLRLINDLRTDRGIRPLKLNLDLSRYAWNHSVSMARQRRLYHSSDLRTRLRRYSASRWGENVGMAGTARRVVRLWMRSSSHRANLLDRRFRKTGIGVVKSGGRFWVTQIAYG